MHAHFVTKAYLLACQLCWLACFVEALSTQQGTFPVLQDVRTRSGPLSVHLWACRMEAGDHWVVYARVDSGKVTAEGALSAVHHRKVGTTY